MWRVTMAQITESMMNHFNFKTIAQLAELMHISRQHLHIANKSDRLIPDKLLQTCLTHEIDITRLLRDGKSVKVSDVDYSESTIEVLLYKEGQVMPYAKKNLQKWIAELMIKRDLDVNESGAMLNILSDEIEPKIAEGSTVFMDTNLIDPQSGLFYINLNGYGVVRQLMKAREKECWHLLSNFKRNNIDPPMAEPLEFEKDFIILGKIQSVLT